MQGHHHRQNVDWPHISSTCDHYFEDECITLSIPAETLDPYTLATGITATPVQDQSRHASAPPQAECLCNTIRPHLVMMCSKNICE